MTVSNATRTSFDVATNYSQSYVLINNTLPEMANRNLSFTRDGVNYANSTADSKGFVSFNYTGNWSTHAFEWVLTEAPAQASITSLHNITNKPTYINWVWSDPANADFSKVMIYLNGNFVINVTKGVQSYNATGLSNDTSYTISTHTVDTADNINQTWVNHTAKTSSVEIPSQTFTLAATYDNRLREGLPDTVIGGSTYIDIGHNVGLGSYRDVLLFDLSSYNTGDSVSQALLSLFWYFPSKTRNQSTTLEIYRPLAWDQSYVNWNNKTSNNPWTNKGGDWFDRNNAAQGNVPYASITFSASTLADNRYYDLDVTELVRGYVNGAYGNTGFFLKAKDENDNYIAFYSNDWSNASQRPKLVITTGGVSYALQDIDMNGVINNADFNSVISNITLYIPCPRCDVNNDTKFDMFDSRAVSKYI